MGVTAEETGTKPRTSKSPIRKRKIRVLIGSAIFLVALIAGAIYLESPEYPDDALLSKIRSLTTSFGDRQLTMDYGTHQPVFQEEIRFKRGDLRLQSLVKSLPGSDSSNGTLFYFAATENSRVIYLAIEPSTGQGLILTTPNRLDRLKMWCRRRLGT